MILVDHVIVISFKWKIKRNLLIFQFWLTLKITVSNDFNLINP